MPKTITLKLANGTEKALIAVRYINANFDLESIEIGYTDPGDKLTKPVRVSMNDIDSIEIDL